MSYGRREVEGKDGRRAPSSWYAVEGLSQAMRGSGAMRPAFGQALADLLVDGNIAVRTGAVSALQDFAQLAGADRLAELLRDKPELYSNVKPQGYRLGFGELETAMYALLGNAATQADSAAIEQLREGARKGQSVVLPALARLDPDWLVRNARDVVSRKAIGGVLIKLPSQAHREKVLKTLAPWPDPDDVLSKPFWEMVPGNVDALRRILGEEEVDEFLGNR
ncbi:MAG: hypothetical protein QOH06_6204 [Acidobacteriota bacterium]|jgi:hypothetical protein|nr:hypothetical protein [Acidobacteriota bacterium]